MSSTASSRSCAASLLGPSPRSATSPGSECSRRSASMRSSGSASARDGEAGPAPSRRFLPRARRGGRAGAVWPQQGEWLEQLDAELGNLRAALAWAAERRRSGCRPSLGAALWRYWQVRGYVAEGREILERLLARRSAHVRLERQRSSRWRAAPWFRATTRQWTASPGRACPSSQARRRPLRLVRTRYPRPRKSGSRGPRAGAFPPGRVTGNGPSIRRRLGRVAGSLLPGDPCGTGRSDRGQASLEEGLRGVRELGDLRSVGWVLASLAGIAVAEGDSFRARSRLDEALAIHRKLGDTWGIAQHSRPSAR